jgi:hypothetical protein
MKNTLMILAGLCLCVTSVRGDEAANDKRFNAGEWDLSPYAVYVDKVGNNDWGLGVAGTYYPTEKIGVGGSTYWTDTTGTVFDNAAGELYFRLPALKIIAPYGIGSIGYEFNRQDWFETLGLGIDFRPLKMISAFGDLQWRFANQAQNGVFIRLGVRLSF